MEATQIAAARRGDPEAQRQLFECWYPYVLTVMLHYAADRSDAEELAMDGFVHLFRKLDRYDTDRPFRPWFRQLLVRVALDALRGRLRTKIHEIGDDQSPTTAENRALRVLEREDVIGLLQKLPTSYRLVFNLFVLEEYTHSEISRELGISIGTSKSNLAVARRQLRDLYPLYYATAKVRP